MPQISKRKRAVKRKVKKCVKRKRNSYSLEQKIKVVTYAKLHGRNKAANHFELNGSMVGRWMKASANWTIEISKNNRRVGSGRRASYPEAEKKLYTWIIQQRKQALAVTYEIIRNKMSEILKESEMVALYGNSAENFKASHR